MLAFSLKEYYLCSANSSYAIQWWGTRLRVSISPPPPGGKLMFIQFASLLF